MLVQHQVLRVGSVRLFGLGHWISVMHSLFFTSPARKLEILSFSNLQGKRDFFGPMLWTGMFECI